MTRWLILASALLLGCRPGVKVGDGPFAAKVAEDIPKLKKPSA